MIENIPPKGVSFSDFIFIFAIPDEVLFDYFFVTLSLVNPLTCQNLHQLFVVLVIKKHIFRLSDVQKVSLDEP